MNEHLHPTVRGGLALWTLFVGFAMLMIGNGLNLAVLGVRVVDEGFGVRTSGYVMACYFAGFLLGPALVLRLLPGVGHIRVFASLASIASCVVLVQAVWVSPISWAAMRFSFGFCMAGLYVVVESWLNDASTIRTRGRTLAVYMIVSMGGLAVGQLLIVTGDSNGYVLFIAASILVSLSFVPFSLAAATDPPPVRVGSRLPVRELLAVAPTGVVGMTLTGASHGILFGIGAVYATESGFGPTKTALFIAAPSVGALAFQWPIGWVSDHVPRRAVIFAVAGAAAGLCVAMAVVPVDSVVVVPMALLLGGLTFPLYSLLLSHTLDRVDPAKAIAASGTLLRMNGAGAVVGPVIVASVMAATGEAAMFWCLVVTHGAIAVYVALRLLSEDALPLDRQGPFIPMPARATDLAIRLAGRRRRT